MMSINSFIKISNISYIIAFGAVILFSLGYISHLLLGDNNTIEDMSEELLKREYNINVEFSDTKQGEKL